MLVGRKIINDMFKMATVITIDAKEVRIVDGNFF